MAPQLNLKSRNLRHFFMVGGINLALTTYHFQIWQFNFKALFPVVMTDFP